MLLTHHHSLPGIVAPLADREAIEDEFTQAVAEIVSTISGQEPNSAQSTQWESISLRDPALKFKV